MQGIIGYDALNDSYKINYTELRNKIYKLLPIFEGKVKDSNEKIGEKIAFENFRKNLEVLCLEINGILSKVEITSNLLEVFIILEGLRKSGEIDHASVKYAVLHSTNLLKNLI